MSGATSSILMSGTYYPFNIDVWYYPPSLSRILSTLDRELLKPSASVALHKHSNALVDVLPPEADSSISMLGADEKPDVSYSDIGGKEDGIWPGGGGYIVLVSGR